jgi:membrane-associated phospholipid phosphatase
MRVAVARAVSIAAHPVVLLFVAVLFAASTRGASLRQLWFVGGAMAAFDIVVLGFSWLQVRSGHWSHIDASAETERNTLNVFLGALCFLAAVFAWFLTRQPYMSLGLGLSGTLVLIALLIARWVKVSLHVAFAAFATALVWPGKLAIVTGLLVTSAVVWSRLILGRHVAVDVAAGLLLGATAGGVYQLWIVSFFH